ncbi:MAG: hypothetical protein H0U87_04885 [Acidobacteria bacterium]|jgi:arginine decarboxylase-like protein|nr:hypothetical protein [Acidobacteriota bacterium]
MELDKNEQEAVRHLGATINSAIEKSVEVARAIENLREFGYEPQLTLRLEIGLKDIGESVENAPEEIELELTEEDVQALRRMKIRFD